MQLILLQAQHWLWEEVSVKNLIVIYTLNNISAPTMIVWETEEKKDRELARDRRNTEREREKESKGEEGNINMR